MAIVTVMVREAESTEDVASRLRELGMEEVSEMPHIASIVGKWQGSLGELRRVDGVEDVEEQETRYFPS